MKKSYCNKCGEQVDQYSRACVCGARVDTMRPPADYSCCQCGVKGESDLHVGGNKEGDRLYWCDKHVPKWDWSDLHVQKYLNEHDEFKSTTGADTPSVIEMLNDKVMPTFQRKKVLNELVYDEDKFLKDRSTL